MKLKSLIVASFLVLSTEAFAQWFPARAFVNVHPLQVSVQVMNPYNAPIICTGTAYGQTTYGVVLNTYFFNQFLVPGEFRYAYVQANPYTPFMNGWANINCRFATYW